MRIPVGVTESLPEIVFEVDSEFIKSVGKLEDHLNLN